MLGSVPDLTIAVAYMKLSDDQWSSFWWAPLFLAALQSAVSFKKLLSSILIYRLWAKNAAVAAFTQRLVALDFLAPESYQGRCEDFDDYLTRIAGDETASQKIRAISESWLGYLMGARELAGWLVGSRLESATNAALKQYAAERHA
jgi:hypothetical protein